MFARIRFNLFVCWSNGVFNLRPSAWRETSQSEASSVVNAINRKTDRAALDDMIECFGEARSSVSGVVVRVCLYDTCYLLYTST